MILGKTISILRTKAKLTQEQLAEALGVSQQSVQKWESGSATPDLEKVIRISKHFGVSLDALILGNDNRVVEELGNTKQIKPQYQNMHTWEVYCSNLMTEYQQSIEEGLDIEMYRDIFSSVSMLPIGEIKKKLGDVLFEAVSRAGMRKDYPYVEPSELANIRELRKGTTPLSPVDKKGLPERIYGAWLGRVVGCMLGKTVEGIHTNELIPLLKKTDNYPMNRYIVSTDASEENVKGYSYMFGAPFADKIDGMPSDDDTNYVVLAQEVINTYGRDFTPFDMSRAWLDLQKKEAYCTAERVAFCNFVKGYAPPESAVYKNPFREWIGAQIRGDYFGYINPGNPEMAAEMAWRDASISHIKNGIYGEMFVAAMLAVAATTNDVKTVILRGLAEIPYTSRLYEDVMSIVNAYDEGKTIFDAYAMIHGKFDENQSHGWCHTNSNAMVVVAALLWGDGSFDRTICNAVQVGFDTDCNGATVGSIYGMMNGSSCISEQWTKPIGDKLHTTIFEVGTVSISERAKKTMEHVRLP